MEDIETDPMRLSDGPSAKRVRRRTASASSDACGSSLRRKQSENGRFWFHNGDIILEMESVRFKVHRERLSCSEVFADMLALPQPSNAETVDGVALVKLQDSARDWITALEWMYSPLCVVHQFSVLPLANVVAQRFLLTLTSLRIRNIG